MKKLLTLLLAFAMAFTFTGCSSDKDEETSITIQFVPTNADAQNANTEAFETYMENLLGIDVEVTTAVKYVTIVEGMDSGQIDVGIMPPAAYVQARESKAAISILSSTLVDYDQVTELPIEGSTTGTFKAEVLTKKDSTISSWKDLEGKKVAYLGAASASGYIYPVAEMKDAGVDLSKVEFIEISDVVSAIKSVMDGTVDACFTFEGSRYVFDKVVVDADGKGLLETAKAAILSEGDIPNDAIAVNPNMSDELKAKVKQAFLDMAADPEGLKIMADWGHTGYVESDEKAYDTTADYIAKASE